MKIDIDSVFFVEKDDFCYTLKESTGRADKDGNEITKTHGYFKNLSSAMMKLRVIRASKSVTGEAIPLALYIEQLRKQTEDIKKFMQGLEVEE